MANLKNLEGISLAREDLFNKLEAGEITEHRAATLERILRGQQALKGDLPLKFITLVSRYKGGKLEGYLAATVGGLAEFLEGPKGLPQ